MQTVPTNAVVYARKAESMAFANDGSYASVYRQLCKIAIKCFARVQAMGLSMTFDDVMQEMNLSYVRATQKWSPEGGALFVTYMTTACYQNFNERIRKAENERRNLGMVSMADMRRDSMESDEEGDFMEHYDAQGAASYSVSSQDFNGNGFDDYMESLEGSAITPESPEQILERQQEVRKSVKSNLSRLTPEARQMVLALMMAAHKGEDLPKLSAVAQGRGMNDDELKRVKTELRKALGVRI